MKPEYPKLSIGPASNEALKLCARANQLRDDLIAYLQTIHPRMASPSDSTDDLVQKVQQRGFMYMLGEFQGIKTTGGVTISDLVAVFEDGKRLLVRKTAAKELAARGFSLPTAYRALDPEGEFSEHLTIDGKGMIQFAP